MGVGAVDPTYPYGWKKPPVSEVLQRSAVFTVGGAAAGTALGARLFPSGSRLAGAAVGAVAAALAGAIVSGLYGVAQYDDPSHLTPWLMVTGVSEVFVPGAVGAVLGRQLGHTAAGAKSGLWGALLLTMISTLMEGPRYCWKTGFVCEPYPLPPPAEKPVG